jgi:hypothetical protein
MERDDMTWLGSLRDVAAGLSQREGYAAERALAIAAQVDGLHEALREPFRKWWQSGGVPDAPMVAGHSPQLLIAQGRCQTVPVAFTWLSAFLNDPRRTESLVHSEYDIVSPDPESDLRQGQSQRQ